MENLRISYEKTRKINTNNPLRSERNKRPLVENRYENAHFWQFANCQPHEGVIIIIDCKCAATAKKRIDYERKRHSSIASMVGFYCKMSLDKIAWDRYHLGFTNDGWHSEEDHKKTYIKK